MPQCPNCQAEYRAPARVCPSCGLPLPLLPLETEAIPPEEYVELVAIPDAAVVMIYTNALTEAGIPSIVQKHGPIIGAYAVDLTEDYSMLYVPENRLEEARQLLQALETTSPEWPAGMEPEE